MKLFISALTKAIAGLGLMAALMFAPAGTFAFPGAWRLIVLLFVPMLIIGAIFLIWDPETLSKRLRSKEDRSKQKGVVVGIPCHDTIHPDHRHPYQGRRGAAEQRIARL